MGRRAVVVATLVLVLALAGLGGADRRPPSCAVTEGTGVVAGPDSGMDGATVLTPYPPELARGCFLRGATVELGDLEREPAALADRLRLMRDRYRIDTIGVYDFAASLPAGGRVSDLAADVAGQVAGGTGPGRAADVDGGGTREAVFRALAALDMRAVVRLEAYDPETFAFRTADADRVLDHHAELLEYVAAPDRRARVAYLAVNMPLDDPTVRRRLGGGDSSLSIRRQREYAVSMVSRLRGFLSARGAGAMPIYVGVFYGWDGTYRPPSYAPAGADGYVLTSYAYPGATIPGEASAEADLIDERRRRATMRRFTEQYGAAPVVVEYGVHTAERHAGRRPAQDAGLVLDRRAKRRALVATTRFYRTHYPQVIGTMYFGFNIHKSEGHPPSLLDFALLTP